VSTASPVELPNQPVTIADEQIGVNSAIAAALTRGVGSMPALYTALAFVCGWMALATWGPLRTADPYPFPFLLFLDNVVQLALCLVILVGQRVLGLAADRRAVQTYQSAEAIFEQVADLQEHLDRHDRALSRGVSLLENSPHPWIEQHQVQPPPQAIDQAVGVNGKIAAWLTQRLGSMWAFYAAAATQVLWVGLAEAGVQRFDPYPFAFMTFLSTLAQLIFMIVIMVGQDVLGRAADRRSEQTFLDAEAILHECRRMKARLSAQDRIIDSLAGYAAAQVTEQLAQAIHAAWLQAATVGGQIPGSRPALHRWEELPEPAREANRAQAREIGERLAAIGCLMVPASGPAASLDLTDREVELLARIEHERWLSERAARGPVPAPGQGGRRPYLAPWDQLTPEEQAHNIVAARSIPDMLAAVGFQVLRDDTGAREGHGEADFTPSEWVTLQHAMMAAGVLVSLAEGPCGADEILALVKKLREASTEHPDRFIRELAAASDFRTGLRPGIKYAGYRGPALETIRSATAIVAAKAPPELPGFRRFLTEIAAVVADANNEGGFFGLGARPRTTREAAAMEAVKAATEPE
jgi:uncharacterized membrane protein